ncbi:hypothetical protein [Bacillus taeanensis]|uniref:Uncharacterized protein n=1 Tax=Bacillus taeanensis TaxID=273032 RepID=A0A366XTF8_9BACI|nr:hypothetical protein [Bacillus taeanensis]RBW69660.1 hypothetical protein DS031_10575 [Bacillus taeanensis]
MENLDGILQYYVKGIMNEYDIKEQQQAEQILADALQSEQADIVITEFVENVLEKNKGLH